MHFLEESEFAKVVIAIPQNKLKAPSTTKKPAVIFYNGTFCPVHQGHLHAIEMARNHLEQNGVGHVLVMELD